MPIIPGDDGIAAPSDTTPITNTIDAALRLMPSARATSHPANIAQPQPMKLKPNAAATSRGLESTASPRMIPEMLCRSHDLSSLPRDARSRPRADLFTYHHAPASTNAAMSVSAPTMMTKFTNQSGFSTNGRHASRSTNRLTTSTARSTATDVRDLATGIGPMRPSHTPRAMSPGRPGTTLVIAPPTNMRAMNTGLPGLGSASTRWRQRNP